MQAELKFEICCCYLESCVSTAWYCMGDPASGDTGWKSGVRRELHLTLAILTKKTIKHGNCKAISYRILSDKSLYSHSPCTETFFC